MLAHEAFARLWRAIHNPRSMCPDVELGFVEEQMTQILMEGLEGPKVRRWILARLAFQPYSRNGLRIQWTENVPTPPPGSGDDTWNQYYDTVDVKEDALALEFDEALQGLLSERIVSSDREGILSLVSR